MDQNDGNSSEIAKFFENKSVFITGATGFMGKVSVKCYLYIFLFKSAFLHWLQLPFVYLKISPWSIELVEHKNWV